MDYIFNLNVNPKQLKRYLHGFGYDSTRIDECIKTGSKISARFIYPVKNQAEGNLIVAEFDRTVEDAGIKHHRDDLLYFILCANEESRVNLNNIIDGDEKPKDLKRAAKELAQLMLLYKDNLKNQVNIAFKPLVGKSIKIKSDVLTEWINSAIESAALGNDFQEYGPNHYFGFTIPNDNGVLDYRRIEQTADMPLGAVSIDRNRTLAEFILTVNKFLIQEKIFEIRNGVRYSSSALEFIYRICVLFGWLSEKDRDSTDVDYLHGIIANYHKQYPDF